MPQNDFLVLDFETYYDREYSLRKIMMANYLVDPRFEVLGAAFKWNGDKPYWKDGPELQEHFKEVNWSKVFLIAHNMNFDGSILSWHYGHVPAMYFDTMAMAQPTVFPYTGSAGLAKVAEYLNIGTKGTAIVNAMGKRRADFTPAEWQDYVDYGLKDADLCWGIFKALLQNYPREELYVIDRTVRMFTAPRFQLDREVLEEYADRLEAEKERLLQEAGIHDRSVLMSNEKLATLLKMLGVEPPTKISPRTGKTTYAFAKTDFGMQQLLEHPSETVQNIAAARLGHKSTIEQTRCARFIDLAREHDHLSVPLRYYAAHTGRYGGTDKINLQNLGRESELRRALKAPPGYKVVAVDASQIEARMVSTVAGCTELIEGFARGEDLYSRFASSLYEIEVTGDTHPTERFVGKTCVAEGTPILTERGEVSIEEIKLEDRVWDGVEWVSHKGVVCQGEKEVIRYDGLCATPDHGVFTEHGPLPLGLAASRLAGLLASGKGGRAVWVGDDRLPAGTTPEQAHLLVRRMYEVWRQEVGVVGEPEARSFEGLPVLLANQIGALQSAWASVRRYIGSLYGPITSVLPALWRAGYPAAFSFAHGVHPVGGGEFTAPYVPWGGDRSRGQQRALRAGQSATGFAAGADVQQAQHGTGLVAGAHGAASGVPLSLQRRMDLQAGGEARPDRGGDIGKVRVYDILDAGPRKRYTAAGKLIFNCILGLGYGMGADKLHAAIRPKLPAVEGRTCQKAVTLYRSRYAEIPLLWRKAGNIIPVINEPFDEEFLDGLLIVGNGRVVLPNGMCLHYAGLTYSEKDGWEYRFGKTTKRLYGPKLVENIIQALARIHIFHVMVEAAKMGIPTHLQAHDELVPVVPGRDAEDVMGTLIDLMSTPPTWLPNAPLAAKGAIGDNYKECK